MRILIADDNERVRSGIRLILSNEDEFEICGEAENGNQALDQTRHLLPDLLLLDIHMPDSDGFQVARQLHQEFPQIKILIMSHHDVAMVWPSAFESGASGCIDKACLATDLASRLRQLLEPNAAPLTRSNAG